MSMPYLEAHIRNAQIGIQYDQPNMKIKQPQADLRIQQPAAEVKISREASSLHIDQSEARADGDIKGTSRRVQEWAEKAKHTLTEGVARRVRQGDQMMKIENGGGAIPRIAKENGQPAPKSIGIGFIPKSHFRVQIDYDPGKVDIEVIPHEPIIDAQINKPIIDHENWKANIYLQQKESVSFELKNFNVDEYI
ncbi:DUF6470 family protein [Cytobacillus purgationiresistens]|uniref:YviE n=1 Tax=Cytobacillus purgationiresistens TaxID=863449 RepID=A0ABU0AEC2_9BACI|nr:DUF6470 family protein [Cytobacillus purgationiresistens]MDQ0269091.1 hypothetical protein [Cytobacillus purgationiresistens]